MFMTKLTIRNDESSEMFDMEVLAEGILDKELVVPNEVTVSKHHWKTIYYYNDED